MRGFGLKDDNFWRSFHRSAKFHRFRHDRTKNNLDFKMVANLAYRGPAPRGAAGGLNSGAAGGIGGSESSQGVLVL